MLIKRSIDESLVKAIPQSENAKTFLPSIGERYAVSAKAEAGQLMDNFINMKYDEIGGVRQYIMKMVTLSNKLIDLECPVADKFLVHHALYSLPSKFDALKTSYNTQLKEEWDLNTLISICAQEEDRMNHVKSESVNLVSQPPHKKFPNKKWNKFQTNNGPDKKLGPSHRPLGPKRVIQKKEIKCWFCKSAGHIKSNCQAFKSFLKNKGYRFYCPTRGTKIVEAISAKFLENDMGGFDISIDEGTSSNKEQIVVPIPIVQDKIVYQPIERAGEVPQQEVVENVPPPAPEEPIENPPLRR
ncbi:Zinc finger, CCHC-type superfamily [Sesbania bispinosa]|nr:Zinc finger, CCHC-type superfamily [Sesbania bispinosa]